MESKHDITDLHLFEMFGKDILFNVETMLFYEVTPVVRDLAGMLREVSNPDPIETLKNRFSEEEIKNAALYLTREGFLKQSEPAGTVKKPVLKKRRGIRHLELMITHGCNMRCRYCYGSLSEEEWQDARHLYGADVCGMSEDTAMRGVDFLFEASGRQKEVSVIFFGGEPLLEFDLMEKVVSYANGKAVETGKKVKFSLSTNGLLLNDPKVIEFLNKNKVGCQISIDGPKEIHNRTRCMADGGGSYDAILPGVRRLISKRRGRVPARSTVSHNMVDLPAVVAHLLKLGFGSVHIEPARGSSGALMVAPEDIEDIKRQTEIIAQFLVKSIRENRFFNYSNLVKHIRQTRVVRERLAHYCGAGRTYLALSQDGVFYPCHRFVGMEEYRMGDLDSVLDLRLQRKILNLTVDNRPGCRECWARYLCGGGCWKHAVDANGCLEMPDTEVTCELIRHQIECAMAINSELRVEDRDILSELYEDATEPYLISEKEGKHAA